MLTEIYIAGIDFIVTEVQRSNYECNSLLSILRGEIETQRINDSYNKIVVRDISDSIATVIIDCRENKIESASFHGSIKISPMELFEMYKHYREAYAARDNLYFYFFNENRQLGNYSVSFFEPSHKQIKVVNNINALSNLTLSW